MKYLANLWKSGLYFAEPHWREFCTYTRLKRCEPNKFPLHLTRQPLPFITVLNISRGLASPPLFFSFRLMGLFDSRPVGIRCSHEDDSSPPRKCGVWMTMFRVVEKNFLTECWHLQMMEFTWRRIKDKGVTAIVAIWAIVVLLESNTREELNRTARINQCALNSDICKARKCLRREKQEMSFSAIHCFEWIIEPPSG